MEKKYKTSIQLTPDAKALVVRLANQYGVSQSAIVELAIREKAERSGIVRGKGHQP
jgi:predicted transcriptional regulator